MCLLVFNDILSYFPALQINQNMNIKQGKTNINIIYPIQPYNILNTRAVSHVQNNIVHLKTQFVKDSKHRLSNLHGNT